MAWKYRLKIIRTKRESEGRVISHRSWLLLLVASVVSLAIILWILFGSVDITVQGNGIIVSNSGLASIQAKVAGAVENLHVKSGVEIKKGSLLLEIKNPQVELKLEAAEKRVQTVLKELQQLKNEIENERNAEQKAIQAKISANQFNIAEIEKDIEFLTKKLDIHKGLLDKGLISGSQYHAEEHILTQNKIDLEEKKSSLNELIGLSKKEYRPEELKNKEEQLLSEEQQRDILLVTLNEGTIYSPEDGMVLEIMVNPGDQVQAGKPLIWLEKKSPGLSLNQDIIFAYFPVDEGERITRSSRVEMTVPQVNYNEYGSILGKVIRVSQYAESKENIYNKIQNKAIVDSLIGTHDAVVEVVIAPLIDSSGNFQWTSLKTPLLPISSGTVGTVEATVERVRPLYYILPLPIFKLPNKG